MFYAKTPDQSGHSLNHPFRKQLFRLRQFPSQNQKRTPRPQPGHESGPDTTTQKGCHIQVFWEIEPLKWGIGILYLRNNTPYCFNCYMTTNRFSIPAQLYVELRPLFFSGVISYSGNTFCISSRCHKDRDHSVLSF